MRFLSETPPPVASSAVSSGKPWLPSGSLKEAVGEGMAYLGTRDIVRRWVYTPQGARKVMRSRDFPAPCITVNAGHTRIWDAAEIERYEAAHPELKDDWLKVRKVNGYARAVHRGDSSKK